MTQPTATQPQHIAHRYYLLKHIGAGGMGDVYQAQDRLTGQDIALKRVRVPVDSLITNSTSSKHDSVDLRLALAQEFRVAASLRHPNIISVLDYGFDDESQPFFTMQHLPDAQPLLSAMQDAPISERVQRVIEMLRALAYCRCGIIHRDLKPANVLIDAHGKLKVLDFGLALDRKARDFVDGGSIGGTFDYIAPEIFQEQPATAASDLYSVGIMLHQLLTGTHPFKANNIGTLIQKTLTRPPDLSALPAEFQPVVARLLEKVPAQRYPTAEAAIEALGTAAALSLPVEDVELRESFLQAARFVGRGDEFAALSGALTDTLDHKGSAWLVGGESGVGKSRLLDELRIRALVSRAVVVRGQAVENGGQPYQVWREPLRRLLLAVELSDLELSILKTIIPDIAGLVGRDRIPDAPVMSGNAAVDRLNLTIVEVFRRFNQPLLLLLEDIHWADDSLAPLKNLLNLVDTLPLMIVASYRDDERPDLPEKLVPIRSLKLARLPDDAVAELCASMIGTAAENPEVLELVRKETEGNTYFIVEVVRALAEEAGRLDAIGQKALPASVFTGGQQRLVMRRLSRVPEWGRALLSLAAVAGRALDEAVLRPLAGDVDYERWLLACAETAVLEVQDNTWRFAHDKLREGVLRQLTPEARIPLHRAIAQTIEAVYPNDTGYAEILAEHWGWAGDADKEVQYVMTAAVQLIRIAALTHARKLLEQRLPLFDSTLPQDRRYTRFLKHLGDTYEFQGDYKEAQSFYERALAVDSNSAYILNSVSRIHEQLADYEQARSFAERALRSARTARSEEDMCDAQRNLGNIAFLQGKTDDARTHHLKSLTIAQQIKDLYRIGAQYNNLGQCAEAVADFPLARSYFEQALDIQEHIGDRIGCASTLNNLGVIAYLQNDFPGSRRYYEQSIERLRTMSSDGNRAALGILLYNLADVVIVQQQYDEALTYVSESLELLRRYKRPWFLGYAYGIAAQAYIPLGRLDEAREHLREGLQTAQSISSTYLLSILLMTAVKLAQAEAHSSLAALWAGSAHAHPELDEPNRHLLEAMFPPTRAALGDAAFDALFEQGKKLSLEHTVQEVLLHLAS